MGKVNRSPPPVLVLPERTRRTRQGSSSLTENNNIVGNNPNISEENDTIISADPSKEVTSVDMNFISEALVNISSKYDTLLNKFNDLSKEFLAVKDINISLVDLITKYNNQPYKYDTRNAINSFASVVKNNPVVVVKPKNSEQNTAKTILDINNKLDPKFCEC